MWCSHKFLFLCVQDARRLKFNGRSVRCFGSSGTLPVPGSDFLIRSLLSPRKFTVAKFILPVNSTGYVSSVLSIRSFRVSREISSRVLAWIPQLADGRCGCAEDSDQTLRFFLLKRRLRYCERKFSID